MSDFSQDQGNQGTDTDQLTFQVGEREYDAEAAATKIQAADEHISRIEAENKTYKEQLEAAKLELASTTSVQEALQKLQQPASTQESQSSPPTEGLSEDQIREIAKQQAEDLLTSNQRKAQEQAEKEAAKSTFNNTKAALEKQFGDKTEQVMNEKAAEMGVPIESLIQLASNPATASLLLDSMKVAKPTSTPGPSASFNTASNSSQAPEGNSNWWKGSSNDIYAELQRLKQTQS